MDPPICTPPLTLHPFFVVFYSSSLSALLPDDEYLAEVSQEHEFDDSTVPQLQSVRCLLTLPVWAGTTQFPFRSTPEWQQEAVDW
jgi:hypothetical protein